MLSSLQFLTILGVSFFGTFGAIILFWIGGIVRTNLVWFIAVVSSSMFDDSTVVASVQSNVDSIPVDSMNVDSMNEVDSIPVNVINHRSSSVKLNGVLGGLPIRPVARIYSDADRIRARDSIRVCQLPVNQPSTSFKVEVIERRYEPSKHPTSDIFGP